jgi:hypothetical protein
MLGNRFVIRQRRRLATVALMGSELPQGPIARAHGWAEYRCMGFCPDVVKLNRCRLNSHW